MWIIAMFDLPVDSKEAREDYRKLVKALLRDGFERMQFSIYIRYCASEENAVVHRKLVANHVPPDGEVRVLQITDKQFERIETYCGRIRPASTPLSEPKTPLEMTPEEVTLRKRQKYHRKPIVAPDQISFF